MGQITARAHSLQARKQVICFLYTIKRATGVIL